MNGFLKINDVLDAYLLRLYGTIRYFVIFLFFICRDQNQIRTL